MCYLFIKEIHGEDRLLELRKVLGDSINLLKNSKDNLSTMIIGGTTYYYDQIRIEELKSLMLAKFEEYKVTKNLPLLSFERFSKNKNVDTLSTYIQFCDKLISYKEITLSSEEVSNLIDKKLCKPLTQVCFNSAHLLDIIRYDESLMSKVVASEDINVIKGFIQTETLVAYSSKSDAKFITDAEKVIINCN